MSCALAVPPQTQSIAKSSLRLQRELVQRVQTPTGYVSKRSACMPAIAICGKTERPRRVRVSMPAVRFPPPPLISHLELQVEFDLLLRRLREWESPPGGAEQLERYAVSTTAIDAVVLETSFDAAPSPHRISDSTTVSRDPGLRTVERHVSRSPFAARSRLILNSTVRTM